MTETQPDRALAVLETIEDAATRTLQEMRAIVAVLRDGAEPDLAPRPGVGDIERLACNTNGPVRIDVQVHGDVHDLTPSVGAALYRLAQESATNAMRHARSATNVTVHVTVERDVIHLRVRDRGRRQHRRPRSGHGLLGMAERTSLLGGEFQAGPSPEGGWVVNATLPKNGARATSRGAATRGAVA